MQEPRIEEECNQLKSRATFDTNESQWSDTYVQFFLSFPVLVSTIHEIDDEVRARDSTIHGRVFLQGRGLGIRNGGETFKSRERDRTTGSRASKTRST